ncbi:unnamed protein product [Sphacelaria rigidula]
MEHSFDTSWSRHVPHWATDPEGREEGCDQLPLYLACCFCRLRTSRLTLLPRTGAFRISHFAVGSLASRSHVGSTFSTLSTSRPIPFTGYAVYGGRLPCVPQPFAVTVGENCRLRSCWSLSSTTPQRNCTSDLLTAKVLQPNSHVSPSTSTKRQGKSLTETNKMAKAMELIDDGYRADLYRAIHCDAAFEVVPPAWGALTRDETLLPPQRVQGQASERVSTRGPRPRKRKTSNGEFNTSSRYNPPMSASSGGGAASGGGGSRVDCPRETRRSWVSWIWTECSCNFAEVFLLVIYLSRSRRGPPVAGLGRGDEGHL